MNSTLSQALFFLSQCLLINFECGWIKLRNLVCDQLIIYATFPNKCRVFLHLFWKEIINTLDILSFITNYILFDKLQILALQNHTQIICFSNKSILVSNILHLILARKIIWVIISNISTKYHIIFTLGFLLTCTFISIEEFLTIMKTGFRML